MTIGEFPRIGLSEARGRAEALRGEVQEGHDPAGVVADFKAANTVTQLLDLFIKKHPRPDAAWTKECARVFKKDVEPVIGNIKLPNLTRAHVRQVVERVRERGVGVAVNRTLAALRRAFSWAVSNDLLTVNPALNMPTDIEEKIKDRALNADEIKVFWSGLDHAAMSARSRIVLRLVLATGQRPGEVCGARKSEVNLETRLWLIPAARAKNRKAHTVPLSDLVAGLFEEAINLSIDSEFVFPSRPRSGIGIANTTAVQSHALSHAMQKNLKALGLDKHPATPHDLRRTAASHMARLGLSDRIVGRVLNHGSELRRTITSQVYIHHDYLVEKRHALGVWAAELQHIIGDAQSPSNVIELRASS